MDDLELGAMVDLARARTYLQQARAAEESARQALYEPLFAGMAMDSQMRFGLAAAYAVRAILGRPS
jgi:hypothetical protein